MTNAEQHAINPDQGTAHAGDARALEVRGEVQELTAALAARDSLIAVMGHELRNSVAPMLLLAEQFEALAGEPGVQPVVARRAATLTRNLHRFITTLERVAQVTDLRRGKVQLEPSQVDLVAVVDEVCRDARREAAAAGAELVVDAGKPVTGQWDRDRLKQIVANLVSNAIRYGGGSRIELGIRGRDGDVELVIRDHGPGLDPAVLPRLFDPFDHARARRGGGLGVGLWVVKTLCAAMRGTVTATNASNGGACFCIVLPRGANPAE